MAIVDAVAQSKEAIHDNGIPCLISSKQKTARAFAAIPMKEE